MQADRISHKSIAGKCRLLSLGIIALFHGISSAHAAVSNLSASALSATQISLTWTGTDAAYQLERCASSPGLCTVFYVSGPSFVDRALLPGTTYTYRVKGIDFFGVSGAYSGAVSATTGAAPANPPPVVSLTANGTTFSPPASVTFTAAASDDGAINQVQFYLGTTLIASDSSAPYSLTWSGLLAGSYVFQARAIDNLGSIANSNSVTVTVTVGIDTTAPSVPSGLTATVLSNSQIALAWGAASDASTPLSYELERCSTGTVAVCTAFFLGNTNFTDRLLLPQSSYRYRVRAIDNVGNRGGWSGEVVGVTGPVPTNYTLSVNVTGSGTVTSNPGGISCGPSCSASYNGGTSVTLTAVAASGYSFSGWSGGCSGSGACTVAMDANKAVSATFAQLQNGLLFFDSFEYDVGRNNTNAATLFQQLGRWTGAKTEQSGAPGANGYLYTTTSIPGYSGAFPGGSSSRVLALEARPGSEAGQTDFYLEYGDGENPAYNNTIPGDVWFQFWIYINNYGSQLSLVDGRNKFLYPCNGSYPCQTGKWLVSLIDNSYEPYWVSLGSPSSVGGFLMNAANTFNSVGEVVNSNAVTYDDRYKLGHTNVSERIATNRWTLVKIHIDTSTQSGKYETWMRPPGGAWIKTAEWISGVTPGFTWTISLAHVGGHRTIRIPTTMGRASGSGYDSWYYMDDFAIAATEAALPQYP